jgi:hypothetical protein
MWVLERLAISTKHLKYMKVAFPSMTQLKTCQKSFVVAPEWTSVEVMSILPGDQFLSIFCRFFWHPQTSFGRLGDPWASNLLPEVPNDLRECEKNRQKIDRNRSPDRIYFLSIFCRFFWHSRRSFGSLEDQVWDKSGPRRARRVWEGPEGAWAVKLMPFWAKFGLFISPLYRSCVQEATKRYSSSLLRLFCLILALILKVFADTLEALLCWKRYRTYSYKAAKTIIGVSEIRVWPIAEVIWRCRKIQSKTGTASLVTPLMPTIVKWHSKYTFEENCDANDR